MIEVTAIRLTLDCLIEEVRNLKVQSQSSQTSLPETLPRRAILVSPELAGRHNLNHNTFERMSVE